MFASRRVGSPTNNWYGLKFEEYMYNVHIKKDKEEKMGIKFKFLRAGCGDSILISTDTTNILIDGGLKDYSMEIEPHLRSIKKLDLVVLTHIDNDHICGLIDLVRDDNHNHKIQELWFNAYAKMKISASSNEIGFGQGIFFEKLLKEKGLHEKHKSNIFVENSKKEFEINDIKIKLLSPTKNDLDKLIGEWDDKQIIRPCNKEQDNGEISTSSSLDDERSMQYLVKNSTYGEDKSSKNRSSIAFILEYQDKKYLFLGDAKIQVITKSLEELYGRDRDNPIEFEFIKLSHHGSKHNINKKFLDVVKTDTFVTLTNGYCHHHPDKATLALILTHEKRAEKVKFLFNYRDYFKRKISNEEKVQYKFKANYKEEY